MTDHIGDTNKMVCEHGSLKRQCLTCELQEQLQAADDLAKAAGQMLGGHANLYMSVFSAKKPDGTDLSNPDDDLCRRELKGALAAYEKVRDIRG